MAWSLFKAPPVQTYSRRFLTNFRSICYRAARSSPQSVHRLHVQLKPNDVSGELSDARLPMFEQLCARKALKFHPSRLVYASFGCGLLQQDFKILELIAKEPQLRELSVHLIDALYIPPTSDIVEDDHRIHEAALDFAARIRSLASSNLAIRVTLHPSAASYLNVCKNSAAEVADLLVLADCGPEVQTNFLLLAERALKPTGRWFVLFKYADGSREEVTDKNLPTTIAAMLFSRGHQQHCCVISGRGDVKKRPKIFDLSNVSSDPTLWLQFPAVPEAQQKWEHRNLLNCKIAMLAFEHWAYNYTFAYGVKPPKAPMAAAALSKRDLWLRKLLESGVSAAQEVDKATPLHWITMGAAQPDTLEAELAVRLIKAGAKVNAESNGCGAMGCKCTIGASTPLHWAAINRAEKCVIALLEAGADPNALNANKQSPLHIATLIQHAGVVKALLAKGARIDLRDTDGDTPLICAKNKKNTEIVAMLSASNP